MLILKPSGIVPLRMLVAATLFLVAVMLYFGLRFEGYRPSNNVEWLPAGEGLCFKRFSIAYTDDFFPPSPPGAKEGGLTVNMTFRSLDLMSGSFSYLLSVFADEDRSQLLIGQWRHWLLIMNGADHDGRQGIRKLTVDIGGTEGQMNLLTLTSGRMGTSAYLNGKLVKAEPNLHLFYPYQPGRTCLTLGNSVHGQHPWHGVLAGLELYDVAVDPEGIKAHESWRDAGAIAGINDGIEPKIQYRFDLKATGRVSNMSGEDYPLWIPEWMVVLKKEILGWPEPLNGRKWSIVQDMVINWVGFMPLGWMLCAILSRLGGFAGSRSLWLAIGLASAFSFFLEVVQAWLPSRDSSLTDLVMNTLGAATGGSVYSLGWLRRILD